MSGHDITVARLVMVAGMAGMLLPLPAVAWWVVAGIFALDAGWLGRRLVRNGLETHRLHHLVCHLAMLYLIVLMVVRVPGGHAVPGMVMGAGAGSGMGSMVLLAIDLGIVIYFVAVGVWAALRLVPGLAAGLASAGVSGSVIGLRAATAYQLVVSGAMLWMLFGSLR